METEKQPRGKQNLYFIAIIPLEEICREITAFKYDFTSRFESSRALKVLPHITLKAPFKLPAAEHEQTLQWFEQISVSISPFAQELKDFGAFNNNRNPVIFVNPIMNPSLARLQKEVVTNFKRAFPKEDISSQEYDFHPHMTVAYRDLQHKYFKEAWQEYQTKSYAATFEVTSFHLLQHNAKKWNTISVNYLEKGGR